ncbi:MAG: AI-2E family transporter, partial [Clostridia bacterium]|nr:AI-2E family transporter [Clostridia bacterium]
LPDGIFFVIITGIASFYINADFENINRRITSKLPRPIAVWLENTRARIKDAWKSWLKACIWLMAVTFAELFCGFLILGIDYSFTIALLCAAADLLPIIGTGTILIPWSAVLLIEGSYYKGIGLLIIWGVTALVRQILEPRIVGTSIGLDPLITLAAIYAGWKLAGIWGSICAPLLAVLLFGGHTAAAQ